MDVDMRLEELSDGMPGLTPAVGRTLAEAASVCLSESKHLHPVILNQFGISALSVTLSALSVDDQMRRSHADLQDAVEFGACGIAIFSVKHNTGLVVVERASKGKGFDYWIGEEGQEVFFQGLRRLEVSGILKGDKRDIEKRVKAKKSK